MSVLAEPLRVETLDVPLDGVDAFVNGTEQLRDSLKWLYDEIRKGFESTSFDDFYEQYCRGEEIRSRVVGIYLTYYELLGFRQRQDIDQAWEKAYVTEEQRALVDSMMTIEQDWDNLLKEIDLKHCELSQPVDHINAGKIQVIDCDSSKKMNLRSCLSRRYGKFTLFVLIRYYGCLCCLEHVRDIENAMSEFMKKMCNIVLVCKGSRQGGGRWKKLTGVTLSLLADEKQHFVATLKFRRSVWSVCHSKTASFLASLQLEDKDKLLEIDDPLHDVYQLGGDVIIDNNGKIMYYHETKTVNDRPSASDLLRAMPSNVESPRISNNSNHSRSCTLL